VGSGKGARGGRRTRVRHRPRRRAPWLVYRRPSAIRRWRREVVSPAICCSGLFSLTQAHVLRRGRRARGLKGDAQPSLVPLRVGFSRVSISRRRLLTCPHGVKEQRVPSLSPCPHPAPPPPPSGCRRPRPARPPASRRPPRLPDAPSSFGRGRGASTCLTRSCKRATGRDNSAPTPSRTRWRRRDVQLGPAPTWRWLSSQVAGWRGVAKEGGGRDPRETRSPRDFPSLPPHPPHRPPLPLRPPSPLPAPAPVLAALPWPTVSPIALPAANGSGNSITPRRESPSTTSVWT